MLFQHHRRHLKIPIRGFNAITNVIRGVATTFARFQLTTTTATRNRTNAEDALETFRSRKEKKKTKKGKANEKVRKPTPKEKAADRPA